MGQGFSTRATAMMICPYLMKLSSAQTALFSSTTVFSTNSQFEGKDDEYCQVGDITYSSTPFNGEVTCWCSAATDCAAAGAYAQANLGRLYTVTHVGTLGCQWEGKDKDECVTSYKISYSNTASGGYTYADNGAIYSASCTEDAQTETKNTLSSPFEAQYVRLYPQSSVESCSTDWELYGYLPTPEPTNNPSKRPTASPTKLPTKNPSAQPTKVPTNNPSAMPSKNPSNNPTVSPTKRPTDRPTPDPTARPTAPPTEEDDQGEVVDSDQGDDDQGDNEGAATVQDTGNDSAGNSTLFGSLSTLEVIMVAATLCIVCMCCVIAIVITKRVRDGKEDADEDETNMRAEQEMADVASVSSANSNYPGENNPHRPGQVGAAMPSNMNFMQPAAMPMGYSQPNMNMPVYGQPNMPMMAMAAMQNHSGYGAYNMGGGPAVVAHGGNQMMQKHEGQQGGLLPANGGAVQLPAVIPDVDTPQDPHARDYDDEDVDEYEDDEDDNGPMVAGNGATSAGQNPNRFRNGSFHSKQ